ncbi:MAG: radical SAM protein [Bacteroidales bacterium]|nr:radical SAM protein [Bacteroidales bacterium]
MDNKNINLKAIKSLYGFKLGRKLISSQANSQLYKRMVEGDSPSMRTIRMKKYEWTTTLINRVMVNIDKKYISKQSVDRLLDVLVAGAFHADIEAYHRERDKFSLKYGIQPPSFLVISPTQRCNLQCTNCYANSDSKTVPHLSYEVLDRIVKDFRDETGGRFIVLSGGEPLLYRDGDKTLFDLFQKYNDIFFMFYTNGTLINKEMAGKLHQLGNAIPAISVEGFEKETDNRRGQGVHKKILQAFENLRGIGMPFIISVTASNENTDVLLSDEFYKYYFDEQGASFMWLFHVMPIGRGKAAFEAMPTPEARLKLYRKWEKLTKERKYPVADFWNSGVLTDGCIAYGRKGGYCYIDWNGDIMPCVFVPYTVDNINRIYAEGKTLWHALNSNLMKNGREWQNKTQLENRNNPNNLLMPCSIRDHYKNFKENILTSDTKGSDSIADEILHDAEYYENLVKYDEELSKITEPVWEEEYLVKEKIKV